MKSRLLGAVCVFALSATYGASLHSAVIDQQNITPINASFCGLNRTGCTWQQEVVSGMNGSLAGLDIYVGSGASTGKLDIWLGSPWQSGIPDYSVPYSVISIKDEATYIDLSSAAIDLLINDSFTFSISVASGSLIQGNSYREVGGHYPAGDLHVLQEGSQWDKNECYTEGCNFDLAFTSYMSPIPIPPALYLFGSGLLGLIGMAKRKAA